MRFSIHAGLDLDKDTVIEIAVIITDGELSRCIEVTDDSTSMCMGLCARVISGGPPAVGACAFSASARSPRINDVLEPHRGRAQRT